MSEYVSSDGRRYIPSKHVAYLTGYTKDYVGQLCRKGEVEAVKVGRIWYVLETESVGGKKIEDLLQEKDERSSDAAEEYVAPNGKRYLSSKEVARVTGYTKDYIGQLCRNGSVDAVTIARTWFVAEDATVGRICLTDVLVQPAVLRPTRHRESGGDNEVDGGRGDADLVDDVKTDESAYKAGANVVRQEHSEAQASINVTDLNVAFRNQNDSRAASGWSSVVRRTVLMFGAVAAVTVLVVAFSYDVRQGGQLYQGQQAPKEDGHLVIENGVATMWVGPQAGFGDVAYTDSVVADQGERRAMGAGVLNAIRSFMRSIGVSIAGWFDAGESENPRRMADADRGNDEREDMNDVRDPYNREYMHRTAVASVAQAASTTNQDNGMVVVPTEGKSDREIRHIRESFSDEVSVEPDGDGSSGMIEPVFRRREGDQYLYVMVPVSSTSGAE